MIPEMMLYYTGCGGKRAETARTRVNKELIDGILPERYLDWASICLRTSCISEYI